MIHSVSSTDIHGHLRQKRDRNLKRLLNPKSIAIVGASKDPSKAGSQALQSLRTFPGTLYLVHPRETEIDGVRAYPTFEDLPDAVDLAILAIPAQHCAGAAAEAAERGVGGVFIISGGFGEAGGDGLRYQEELAEVCRSTGLRLLGPNTSGFINTHHQCVASFVPGVDRLLPGKVAVVAQSGGVNLSLAFLIDALGEGISVAVGLGNAVDVDTADVLSMLADDTATSAIALHLEGVADGRRLYEVLKTVTPRKPVVAMVAGRAEIGDFAVSHTGNLMGSRDRTVAALTQAGAIVVETTEELAQAAVFLSYGRMPAKKSGSFALVTGQAGPGLLIADSLGICGVALPQLSDKTLDTVSSLLPPMTYIKNPVDTGRPGVTFPQILDAVAGDPLIDGVLVFGLNEPSVLDPARVLGPPASAHGKPVIFGTLGLADEVRPVLAELRSQGLRAAVGPERLALAAQTLVADARGQWLLQTSGAQDAATSAEALSGPFDESRAKSLLRSYGIRVPESVLCLSREEARAAFARLAHPVVVKIAANDIAHKTEVGGVIVNVRDTQQLEEALNRIERIPTSDPGRVLLEEMAPIGVEMIVGGLRDPSWGPIVVVGLGGVMAEALSDSAIGIAPLATVTAENMIESLRGKRVLEGFRDLPKCDKQAIAAAVVTIGEILSEHPEIAEIEINPLRVTATGAMALDALVRIET